MFSNPFPNAFGLNIGDLSIKLVQLKNVSLRHRSPVFELEVARSISLPAGVVVNGEIQNQEVLRRALEELLHAAGPTISLTPWVVASLPETRTFISLLSVPVAPEQLKEADVMRAAETVIPFGKEPFYIDWEVVPGLDSEASVSRVLVGAAPRSIVENYTALLEAVHIIPIALEPEAFSIARSMITAKKVYTDEARAVLDLGAARSSIIIYDHDAIQFSMQLPFSGELLTTALSQKCHLSYEDAEEKKKQIGLAFSEKEGACWTALMEMTDELVLHIRRAIDFYYSHFPSPHHITHITMSGGTSSMKQLSEVLSKKLDIPAEPGKPWKNLSATLPISVSEEASMGYAAAIGLALRAAENPLFVGDMI